MDPATTLRRAKRMRPYSAISSFQRLAEDMKAKQFQNAPGSDDPTFIDKLAMTAASLEEHQNNAHRWRVLSRASEVSMLATLSRSKKPAKNARARRARRTSGHQALRLGPEGDWRKRRPPVSLIGFA